MWKNINTAYNPKITAFPTFSVNRLQRSSLLLEPKMDQKLSFKWFSYMGTAKEPLKVLDSSFFLRVYVLHIMPYRYKDEPLPCRSPGDNFCGKVKFVISGFTCCERQLHMGAEQSCCGNRSFYLTQASCCGGEIDRVMSPSSIPLYLFTLTW